MSHDDGYFDHDIAATYDKDHGGTDPVLVEQTVELLSELSGGGEILEFAVGTGRVALPLAARGFTVKGIELSRAMVAQLRKKETGTPLPVTIGDMTDVRVHGTFSLVFLVFNTIENLTTQEAQIACFSNAAAHLSDGGRFVVETRVPPIQDLPFGEREMVFAREENHTGVDESDVSVQSCISKHVWREGSTTKEVAMPFRYVWPSELDLMAKLAGMELENRWDDWTKRPFTHLSRHHVSVWKKPSR
ncbi:MAG: class I SAM-dependent methyltransferase [Pseudomonadota bacterium]